MQETLSFLRALSQDNTKTFFDAHRDEYQRARGSFLKLCAALVEGVGAFDPDIRGLSPSDCVFRINRDIRFSADKSPYKTYLSLYLSRGGKKSPYSGYYFQVGATPRFPTLVAVGDYQTPPGVLKILREDIQNGAGDFREALSHADPRLHVSFQGALKRVPKPFPDGTPDSQFYRLKAFSLVWEPEDDSFVLEDGLAGRLTELFRSGKPFLDYVNRAIEYYHEEQPQYFSSLDF